MKLDRNINSDGRGKYALIKLRVDKPVWSAEPTDDGRDMRVKEEAVDFGDTVDSEFFVIRLKDKYAEAALMAYAKAAKKDDPEWAKEVSALARRAHHHPNKQRPN